LINIYGEKGKEGDIGCHQQTSSMVKKEKKGILATYIILGILLAN
jgi:hypothetical protein